MRRYIAYIAMTSAIMLAMLGATGPTINRANSDLSYSDGKTLYFKASLFDEALSTQNGNYGGAGTGEGGFLDANQPHDVDKDDQLAIYTLADTIKDRLDGWDLSEYDVEVQGYDTIAVSLKTKTDSDTQYRYLENYLSFSGGDYELDLTDADASQKAKKDTWATMLDGCTSSIESIDMNGYNFPVVIVEIPENYRSDFKDLLQAANDAIKNTSSGDDDSSASVDESSKCHLVLWANRADGDLYSDSVQGGGSNENLTKKILSVESVENDNAVYYKSTDNDKDVPYLRLIPNSEAIGSDGKYDPSHAQEAYEAAVYLNNMFNASKLEVNDGTGTKKQLALNFTYLEDTPASVENLVHYSDWSAWPAFGGTMIAFVVTMALMAIVLALFNRIFSLAQISSILVAVFCSFITFVAFGTQFNAAAMLGLVVTALVAAFGAIYYSASLKDELYKGRTLKKANQEASKKITWPVLDAGILTVIVGIFVYVFGGALASKLGTMLVLGGFFATCANLILTRIEAWLLCNDSTMQTKFPGQLGVGEKKIPNLMKEEKQTYFGAYEKKDFTKGRKWTAGVLGTVMVAGIAMMIAMGVTHSGNVYNTASLTDKSTVLRLDVASNTDSMISLSSLSSISDVYNDAGDGSDLLHRVEVDGKKLSDLTTADDVALSATPKKVYDTETGTVTYWYYYSVKMNAYLANDEDSTHDIQVLDWNTGKWVASPEDRLDAALVDYLTSSFGNGITEENVLVSFATVSPTLGAPYISDLCLALGVALAVNLVYLMLRFRPSHAISLTLLSASVGYLAISFFVITRIAVSPLVTLGAIAAALLAEVLALFPLNKEKEIYKESREKEKNNYAFRSQCLQQANSRAASSFLILDMLGGYAAIAFFAFGPRTFMMIYLCLLMGLAFATAADLSLLAPSSILVAGWFSKIHLKPRAKKKKKHEIPGQITKKKGAEPEEAIFIGINDY